MSGVALLAALLIGAMTKDDAIKLDLLGRAASASFYASDQFRCQGYSDKASIRRADKALGSNFRVRLDRAAGKLKALYGADQVDQRLELLPIGYRITPARCAKVRHLVEDARTSLSKLEAELGNT